MTLKKIAATAGITLAASAVTMTSVAAAEPRSQLSNTTHTAPQWWLPTQLEIRNETNQGTNPGSTLRILTYNNGNTEEHLHEQAILSPGQSWTGRGSNSGSKNKDVNALIQERVDGNWVSRLQLVADNDSVGNPDVTLHWDFVSKQSGREESVAETKDLASGKAYVFGSRAAHDHEDAGQRVWAHRAADANDHKVFTAAIWNLPSTEYR